MCPTPVFGNQYVLQMLCQMADDVLYDLIGVGRSYSLAQFDCSELCCVSFQDGTLVSLIAFRLKCNWFNKTLYGLKMSRVAHIWGSAERDPRLSK